MNRIALGTIGALLTLMQAGTFTQGGVPPTLATDIKTKFQNVTRAPPKRSASFPPSGRATEPTSAPR